MLPMNSTFDYIADTRMRCKPPVVKQDLHAACAPLWQDRALYPHIGEIERLLMIDADAPIALDQIPVRDSMARSFVLVDVVKNAYSGNQQLLGGFVKRVGGALKTDRVERGASEADSGIEADLESITRTVVVNNKPQWRPRGE